MCVKMRYPKKSMGFLLFFSIHVHITGLDSLNFETSPNVQEEQIARSVEDDRCAMISFHGYLRSGNEGGGHTVWLRLITSVSFWDRTSHSILMKVLQ